MKLNIPIYIEGVIKGQYKGNKENIRFDRANIIYGKYKQYSVNLYKDVHINETRIITEEQYLVDTVNSNKWWKVDITAEAAIEFITPFFEDHKFLRHKPIEIYVEWPKINLVDKREGDFKTYGFITGNVKAKLVEPIKHIEVNPILKAPVVPSLMAPMIDKVNAELPLVTPTILEKNGCFRKNDNVNGYFGLEDGVKGTGGCFGLTGGSSGPKGCFGNYGNPRGCFSAPMGAGCFPNLGIGCLLPAILLLLLSLALIKSCKFMSTLNPIVNTIKQDRDNSRIPPPVWVNNPKDTVSLEPDYIPINTDSLFKIDSIKSIMDTTKIIDTIPSLAKGNLQLMLWDWDVEDRDTVSVFLNNKLIVENLRLRKKPFLINEKGLKYGENYLLVVAMNTDKGSNTVALMGYSDRNKLCDTALKLRSFQTTRMTLNYK